MKFVSKNNPSPQEVYEIINDGLRKKAMITLYACCCAKYNGRAKSQLGLGERMILIKPDGSFMIHQDHKLDPVNWQPPKSHSKVKIENETVFLESVRRSPEEHLFVKLNKTYLVSYCLVRDTEDLEVTGHEKDMGKMLWKHPSMIEKGFRPTDMEYATESGFIDILGKDEEGHLTILELKSRKAGISAVKQLLRYVNDFKEDKERVRGILVAPGVTDDAQEMLDKYELEFKMVEPPKELKIDKKVTLDFFVKK